jgi:Uma2 family endonuclease
MARSSTGVRFETCADVLHALGDVGPDRVRIHPVPGTATERDLLRLMSKTDRLFELVDGTLVEKAYNYADSGLTVDISYLLGKYLDEHDLGLMAGPDGTMRLRPGLVLAPDISYVSWEQLPDKLLPIEPFPDLFPELAVDVLSEGNTDGEMKRRREEYFRAGSRLVWFVRRQKRTIEVFKEPDQSTILTEKDTIDGGNVFPGLRIPLKAIFARSPPEPGTRRRRRG